MGKRCAEDQKKSFPYISGSLLLTELIYSQSRFNYWVKTRRKIESTKEFDISRMKFGNSRYRFRDLDIGRNIRIRRTQIRMKESNNA